jgi:hypothetical protein
MTLSRVGAQRFALIASSVLIGFACGGTTGSTSPSALPDNALAKSAGDTSLVARRGALVQTLRLSSLVVRAGDSLTARSVLVNGSASPVTVWRGYPCRLDATETALQGRAGCLPPTASVILQPGDSVVGAERWVVRSAPGEYSFTVRQTVDTSLAVTARITVMP